MATFTTNYNLRKPATSDFISVATDINANMDTIDSEIKQREDEVVALDSRVDAIEAQAPTVQSREFKEQFIIVKAASESVTSSTALQNDNDFTFSVEANSTYILDFHIRLDGIAAADLKLNCSCPSDATGEFMGLAADAATTSPGNTNVTLATRSFSGGSFGAGDITWGTDTTDYHAQAQAILNTVSAGTFTLRWAQSASDGTAVAFLANSFVKVERYAA